LKFYFNSIQLILDIPNYELASEGFTICTHTTSLTFDLTSDQEKFPPKKEEKVRTLQESNRGGSLSRMDRQMYVM